MGKFVLTLGSNFYDLARGVISQINEKSDWENYLIVPDRFSLLAEQEVFLQTKTNSVFNTNVLPISSFAIKMLESVGEKVEVLTAEEESFLVRKAVEISSKQFLCFSKNLSPAFIDEIAKTIQQLKASKVTPEDLLIKNGQEGFDNKIKDTQLIFFNYQKLLNQKKDSSDLLNLFNQNIQNILQLKTKNIYFAGFDSFTNQTYEIILQLKKVCPLVCVGAYFSNGQKNSKIFEMDVYNKFKKFLKDEDFEIIISPLTLNQNQNHIAKNMFAKNFEQKPNDNYLKVFEAEDTNGEVEFVLRDIVSKIKQGAKFNDFAIACSSLESYTIFFEQKMKDYQINYYLDTSQKLSDNLLSKFVLNFLKIFLENYEQQYLFSHINSSFVLEKESVKNEMINQIKKFDLQKKENQNNIFQFLKTENSRVEVFFDNLKTYESKLMQASTNGDYVEFVNQILKDFNCEQVLINLSQTLRSQKQIKQEKLTIQAYQKILETLVSIQTFLKDQKTNLTDFYKTLENSLQSKKISTVPISGDCVFVGDATDSFYKQVKTLYVLGCGGDSLPRSIYDCGLINDNDILTLNEKLDINPTIKMINRRNKFKLFNLLTYPSNNLILTYPLFNSEGLKQTRAVFANDLCKLFLQDGQIVHPVKIKDMSYFANDNILQSIVFESSNYKLAKTNLFKLVRANNSSSKIYDSLLWALLKQNIITEEELNYFNPTFSLTEIKNAKELFFANDKISVSQLQTYFDCPFRHFVEYGLKIKEGEQAKVNSKDIGTLLHLFAEKFLNKNKDILQNLTLNQIKQEVENIFDDISKMEEFYKFSLNEENKMINKYLKYEAENLAIAFKEQDKVSSFKTTILESKIFEKNFFDYNIHLSGIVDRIDEYNQEFRIVDYKSGDIKIDEKKVYIGDKIQLLVYARAVATIIKKQCVGALYFPIKNNFSEKYSFKMKGFFKKDPEVALAMDNSLSPESPISSVFECKVSSSKTKKEKGEITLYKTSGTESLNQMIDYSVDLSNNAIKEILQGNIAPAPIQEKYKSYKYKAFFDFDLKSKNVLRQCKFDVKPEFFDNYKK